MPTRLLPMGLLFLAACAAPRRPQPPITVFAAASLARPLRALADSFRAQTGIPVNSDLGGSMELSRRVTELHQAPDVLFFVDDALMAALVPSHLDWYARFATNHLVVAFTDRSALADSVAPDNWWRILTRGDVTVGRADSALAPAGRRALAVIRGAESYYHQPGLTRRLLARAPERYVRPDAAQLAALLQAGEVDYVLDYQSMAEQYGFRYVDLPTDLSEIAIYTVSVPRAAPDSASAERFVAFVLSDAGRAVLRAEHVNTLDVPVAMGRSIPASIRSLVRVDAAASPAP